MPFLKLKYHIKIKGKQKRLLDLLTHISKNIYNASFYDGNECRYGENFTGKRVKRGLYLTCVGREVNADVNGALNILNKSNSNDNKISCFRSSGLTIPKRIQVSL